MEYQEKILDGLKISFPVNLYNKFYLDEDFIEEFYDKLLFYYKLANNELFDKIISENANFFTANLPDSLELGKLYYDTYFINVNGKVLAFKK